jgi:hypothetical protein
MDVQGSSFELPLYPLPAVGARTGLDLAGSAVLTHEHPEVSLFPASCEAAQAGNPADTLTNGAAADLHNTGTVLTMKASVNGVQSRNLALPAGLYRSPRCQYDAAAMAGRVLVIDNGSHSIRAG